MNIERYNTVYTVSQKTAEVLSNIVQNTGTVANLVHEIAEAANCIGLMWGAEDLVAAFDEALTS